MENKITKIFLASYYSKWSEAIFWIMYPSMWSLLFGFIE